MFVGVMMMGVQSTKLVLDGWQEIAEQEVVGFLIVVVCIRMTNH